jgi:hypothetical protein
MVDMAGFEPASCPVKSESALPLSYIPLCPPWQSNYRIETLKSNLQADYSFYELLILHILFRIYMIILKPLFFVVFLVPCS